MLCLSPSVSGALCIQHGDSGCSDNHVGCTEAGLYNRGNSGDMQTGVRGPSINLTGRRSCQEYERMLWSMLPQRVCVSLRSYHLSPSKYHQSVWPWQSSQFMSISLSGSGTTGKALFSSVWIILAQNQRGGESTTQRSHQTVCVSVPRGNQFNSPQLLASRGRGGWGGRRSCVCVCVWERAGQEMEKGGVTAFLGEREI